MPKKIQHITSAKSPLTSGNIPVHFNASDYQQVKAKSKEAGYSLSEYIRRCALSRHLPPIVTDISIDTYRELGRIGADLKKLTATVQDSVASCQQDIPIDLNFLHQLQSLLIQTRKEIAGIGTETNNPRTKANTQQTVVNRQLE
ncbi:MAG: hypothetical protein DSM106950_35590 [Stigonema ocellatum SAG 48.90 = DSM 106950]|nr:hypothetical protein [Stigonema ocellatum SAG 48.90 = DSM 106950]